jgi:uncharacterized coiled-coil DUF342 family protein
VDSANESVAQLKAELLDVQQDADEARAEAEGHRRAAEEAEARLRQVQSHSQEELLRCAPGGGGGGGRE